MNPPRSERYDDVYFSEDGLSEKRAVFLEGADVVRQWQGRSRFVIGELGFGTGLSMLATYEVARLCPGHVQFVSIEAHPLPRAEIASALSAFPEINAKPLLRACPEKPLGPGVHHFDLDESFSVTLWVGDVLDRLRHWDGLVDAWYLDGFAPAKNPEMWTDEVFAELARLSARNARIASYTSAGEVRRRLERAGFEVERVSGHGNKRHRIVGRYRHGRSALPPRSVSVVGAGIGGACVARSLRRRGVRVTVIDGGVDRGASRNPVAVLSPRINRLDDAASRLHVRAFEYASRVYGATGGFDRCGVVRSAVDADLEDRLTKGLERTALTYGPSRSVSANEASEIAGIALSHHGVWLPEGGLIDPRVLLPALLDGAEFHDAEVEAFDFEHDRSADAIRIHTSAGDVTTNAVVIAAGAWAHQWLPELPLRSSRGQLTLCEESLPVQTVVSAHGYLSKAVNGYHVLGATYARDDMQVDVRTEDDERNLERVAAWAPAAANMSVQGGRASQRAQVPDHLPLVGQVGVLRVIGALGSRGFTLAPLAAEVLVAEMCYGVPPLERASRAVISPERYLAPAGRGPIGSAM